jgi:hypothetical protein
MFETYCLVSYMVSAIGRMHGQLKSTDMARAPRDLPAEKAI